MATIRNRQRITMYVTDGVIDRVETTTSVFKDDDVDFEEPGNRTKNYFLSGMRDGKDIPAPWKGLVTARLQA